MKLVIDRKLWVRGYEKNVSSALMIDDGRMCCLGFHALACGLSVDEIKPQTNVHIGYRIIHYPYKVVTNGIRPTLPEGMEWLTREVESYGATPQELSNSKDAQDLANINDRSWGTDEEREREIAAIFAKHDVEVEFIN